MPSLSRATLCGALASLTVLIGATTGPANAALSFNSLTANSLTANSLTANALSFNALSFNALPQTGTATTGLGELNGVQVEAVRLPEDAGR